MKKLLIPLIILLLIIGYFMSRSGEHKAKEAYDSMNSPNSEQMNDNSKPSGSGSDSTSPNGTATPPDGMGNPDAQMPQDSEQTDPAPPGADASAGEGPDTMGAGSSGDSGASGPTPIPGADGEAADTPDADSDTSTDNVVEDAAKEAQREVEGADNLDDSTPDSDSEIDQGMKTNEDEP